MVADKHKGVQYNVRLDAGLLKDLRKAAKKNRVSLTAEMAMRLGKSVGDEKVFGAANHWIFEWAATFMWAGEQAAQLRKIEKNQWINNTDCLLAAWHAASEAVLVRIVPNLSDRVRHAELLRNHILSQQLTAEMNRAAEGQAKAKRIAP